MVAPVVVHMPQFTQYPVIVLPPLSAGACHDTVTCPSFKEVAVTLVGSPGTVWVGMAEVEDVEAGPAPTALMATTVNV